MELVINLDYKNKKYNLNRKLIFSFTSIMLLGIITIGIFVNLIVEKKFAEYVSQRNEQEVENIKEDIQLSYKGDRWNTKKVQKIGLNALNDGMLLDIYDNNNNLVWSATKYDEDMCHQKMNDIRSNMDNRYPSLDANYKEEKFEITENSEGIGTLSIGYYGYLYYLDNEMDFLNDINRVIIVVATILILISIILSILISNSISRPIANVSEMAKVIEDGNYKNKIEYKSSIKEVDGLINSINKLADSLNNQEVLRKRLTTDVAHELRTPLTSIQTHLEAILDGIWEPTNSRITSINEEVIRLANLVSKLNSLSKLENNEQKLNIQNVSVSNLIQNIIYNFQSKAIAKNIDINYKVENFYADIDKDKISQVVVNLISNAIRYTDEGGKIDINLKQDLIYTYISIKDTGSGIPQMDLIHIFERFYRVDKSRSKNTGGIGVGLTISKAIVNLHKGDIKVKSTVNIGSDFTVVIPRNLLNS